MRITSFEHGCEIMGCEPKVPIVDHLPPEFQKAPVAAHKLFMISAASWKGEGKKIDWDNRQQRKWSPYWWMNKPGFRLVVSICDFTGAGTSGGSRLCYPSEADSDYHAEQHKELYRDLMVKED